MIRRMTALVVVLTVAAPAMAGDLNPFFKPVSYDRYVNDAGCGDTACAPVCEEVCCCPCPTFGPCACSDWYGGAEAVYLKRNRPQNHSLSFLDNQDAIIFDTDDLEFDHEWGYRITLGHRANECTAYEFSFLNLTSWNGQGQVFTPDPGNPQLDPYWGSQVDVPTDSFDDSFAHYASYDSNLRDVEINGRHFIDCNTSWLVGFRYINLNEDFNFLSLDNASGSRIAAYNIDTSNDLFGIQVGYAKQWCCGCRFSFGAYGKAGVFYNNVDSNSHIVNVTSSGLDRDERRHTSEETFSTIVDLGLMGTYCVTDHCRLRAGYMVVFLNNLALAPEQLDDAPNQYTLTGNVSDNGSLIYQGPTAGLDICW